MSAVAAVAVAKMWNNNAGLRPTDLLVEAGEVVAVTGRSGSGKSTLLAVLAGWCQADSGTVQVNGAPPRPDEPWTSIALVPQSLCLAVELSLAENVADAAPATDPERVAVLLAELDLAHVAERTLEEVSTGQQQRAALARALVANPLVLLVDEPTSFQDGAHVTTVVAALRRAAKTGSAVVVATHDPAIIDASDRVVQLHDES